MHRNQLLVTNLDSQQVEDVGKWFAAVKTTWYYPVPGLPGAPPLGDAVGRAALPAAAATPGGAARRPEAATAPPGRADRANLRPPLP